MDKEKIIEMIKALGLTAEELGFTDTIKRDTEFDELVKRFIDELDLKNKAKDYFPEKYYDTLGIEKDKYKIVEVRLSRKIYKEVLVAIPEDDEPYDVWDYLPDVDYELDNDYPDEQDNWEDEQIRTIEDNLTAEDVKYHHCEEDLMNFENFERR